MYGFRARLDVEKEGKKMSKIFNLKNIKNVIGIALLILGSLWLLRFIGVLNSPYRMSHAMEIFTESAISIPAIVVAIIFLFIGKKLVSFSILWLYRVLFIVTFFIVSKNAWLYSYVPYEIVLGDGNHIYPDLNSDIFAFVIVGILLLNSIVFRRDKQSKTSDLNNEN